MPLKRINSAACCYRATGWQAATALPAPATQVVAETQPPITEQAPVTAVSITNPKPGVYVYKYPDVTSGWAQLTGAAPAGTSATLKFGEKLNGDGTVDSSNPAVHTGSPQTDTYVFKGHGNETWEPRFSYDGYQYIEIDGYPTVPTKKTVAAVQLHSDVAVTGSFTSSNTLLNTLHTNTVRTILNNLDGIPTDTPEYEKNGWMEDAQVIAPTAIDNLGMDTFYEKWLYDITDSQTSTGQLPVIAPDDGWGLTSNAPEWSAALPLVTWYTYQHSGDPAVLSAHYAAIKSYVDYLAQTQSLIFHSSFGDWSSPGYAAPPEGSGITATAYVYLDADLLAQMATKLGNTADAAKYQALEGKVAAAFNGAFLDPATGTYHSDVQVPGRQTPEIVPLAFGLAPGADISTVVDALVADVHGADDHLNTGSIGNEFLLPTLTENGQVDLAYKVVNQTTYPSQGYWVTQGATTDWEGWAVGGRSLDHAFLGSIDDWFFKDLAGLQPGVGGATAVIHPYFPQGLTRAAGSVDTARGTLSDSWTVGGGGALSLDVTVPGNSTAEIDIPASSARQVTEGNRSAANASGVRFDRMEGGRAVFTIGSGTYHFHVG